MKLLERPFFAFVKDGNVHAVIQAIDKDHARGRVGFVNHLVEIPNGCKLRKYSKQTFHCHTVFFDSKFWAVEEALGESR